MRVKSLVLSSLLLLAAPIIAFAGEMGPAEKKSNMFKNLDLGLLGGYTHFKFDSTEGANFSRFSGNSNLYAAALGNIQVTPKWLLGLAYFRVDTSVNSQIFINPGVPAIAEQTVHNNTIFAHGLRQITPKVFLDLAGAYGQNSVNGVSRVLPNTAAEQIGSARTNNTSWFTSVTAIYTQPWKNFSLNANARLLYSQLTAGSYVYSFTPTLGDQTVLPLTNKVFFAMENVEVGYKFEPNVMPLRPFVNAGLIQVLHFSNSRPVLGGVINGASPQLSMNKNGYRLGGGVSLQHKKFTLRLEEQYYRSAGTYTSYQTLLGLRYTMS